MNSEEIKNKLISRFDKKQFALLNCETAPDGDWNGVDEYIREFIKQINNSEHISTLYSCEGHKEDDSAYLFFNVDEKGWDIFWQRILPEISYLFCQPVKIENYIPENPNVMPFYQLSWTINVTENEYNAGISVHCNLATFFHENGQFKILVGWEEKKERFWNIIKESFIKHFKQ